MASSNKKSKRKAREMEQAVTAVNQKEAKKDKKKKSKKRKRQENDEHTADVVDDKRLPSTEPVAAQTSSVVKKEKKSRKKKKHKKSRDGEEPDTSPSSSAKKSKERTEKEAIMQRNQEKEAKALMGDKSTLLNLATPPETAKPAGVVESSAIEFYDPSIKNRKESSKKKDKKQKKKSKSSPSPPIIDHTNPEMPARKHDHSLTLLLFYQYVEPVWDESTYEHMLTTLQKVGNDLQLTGRMRVAREGLNCTLTASHSAILEYCATLKRLRPQEFQHTEFKLTRDLPVAQKFPNLKVFKVVELVHYGLEGPKAPPIAKYHGTHLEPKAYHKKLAEPNTVIIDVRNHYEAAIGRFVPPQENGESSSATAPPPKWIDPKMRKSTEFPPWLDKPETRQEMKGKQVLMYCTGGIRCERASALLKYKMETDPEIKALGIKGVYQLQGGIDKYFKEFPDGGYWQGKNYVFDKRFAHAPPKIDGELHGRKDSNDDETADQKQDATSSSSAQIPPAAALPVMGKCEACTKPWDMYRGKRRCPTCGVPL